MQSVESRFDQPENGHRTWEDVFIWVRELYNIAAEAQMQAEEMPGNKQKAEQPLSLEASTWVSLS